MQVITFAQGEEAMDWHGLVAAFRDGHTRAKAEVKDLFLYRGNDTVLSRSAWIDGMGMLTKTATVFPGNPSKDIPMIGGGVLLFDDNTGVLDAVIDFHLVTKWKTAGDSLLGALTLAPTDARNILIAGAGTVAASLVEAFRAGFPDAEFTIWNRSPAGAQALADKVGANVATELSSAVGDADIILTSTMATDPIIKGEWLRPGQHLNMIGAYRPDMREADDTALRQARIYVDSFDTTLDHIGELKIPLSQGTIKREDVLADFYGLADFARTRDDITIFKNGGGAHLDLMTAHYIASSLT